MAIKRFIKKPSVPSLTGWPDWAHGVMSPIKQTLEIITGRRGEKLEQLSGPVELDAVAEKVNEVIRVLQDGQDVDVQGAALPPAQTQVTVNNISQTVLNNVSVGQTFTQTVGDGMATDFTLSHQFGSLDVFVLIRSTASPKTQLETTAYDVTLGDANHVTITFASAPTTGQYEVFLASFNIGGTTTPNPVPGKQIYGTPGVYSFIVPNGVTALNIKVWGAGGGGGSPGSVNTPLGGGGGFGLAQLAVTPGETLTIRVGGGGQHGIQASRASGGGELCGVFRGATLLSSTPLVIGGSGGGSGGSTNRSAGGGAGGGTNGASGEAVGQLPAGGGTQITGGASSFGAGAGTYLTAGAAGSTGSSSWGAQGGAGYYGGGGARSANSSQYAAAGGGSGYVPSVGSPLLASGAPAPTLAAGSGQTPAGQSDSDYGLTNAGLGGGGGANGNPGRVVLIW